MVTADAEGNLEITFRNQFTNQPTHMHVGHVGAVQASYVALLTPKGLLVVDPLKGTALWRKTDVPIQTRVFGDEQCLFTVDLANGVVGSGQAYRAIDGTNMKVPDFGVFYQNKIRILGRKLLTRVGGEKTTVKLYDITSGKDVWSQAFHPLATVLITEDFAITGVIEPGRQGHGARCADGQDRLSDQGSPGAGDEGRHQRPGGASAAARPGALLHRPEPADRRSSRPADPATTILATACGCRTVNGWVLAFFREEGEHLGNDDSSYTWDGKKWVVGARKLVKHKKGDLAWRSPERIDNQLIIVEQFENLPVMLFSARYPTQVGVQLGWLTSTQCLLRETGKRLYWNVQKPGAAAAPFGTFAIDTRDGSINLVGSFRNSSVQIYVDDGRPRLCAGAPAGAGAMMPAPGMDMGFGPGGFGPGGFGPGGFNPGGFGPGGPIIIQPFPLPPPVMPPPPPPGR